MIKPFSLSLFIICAAVCSASAQMSLALTGCNSLRAQVEGLTEADLQQGPAFALERLIAPGTWISVSKSYESGASAQFKNLAAGTYRAKFVLTDQPKTKEPAASNIVEVKACPERAGNAGQITSITLSPNPADEYVDVFFTSNGEDVTVLLYDIAGRKIKSSAAADNTCRIVLSDLNAGAYFVVLEQNAVQIAREKLIVH